MTQNRRTSVLITGCTPGGIGHALAVEFHKRGCHVIATARRTEVLADLAGLGMSIAQLDVTSPDSIAACKKEVEKMTDGRIDILVNNAGRTHTIPAVDMELDDVRQTYETNVFGPMLTIQGFIGLLIPARGLIINISSASANFPYLFGAIYSSTKGALDVYSRALRVELKPLGVRVMVASTGTVRSNIANRQHRSLPPGSLYEPIRDVFERRLVFSQNNGTVATEVYAANLVTQALKGEGWLGGWLGGTPNWYTTGGLSTLVWALTCIPRWMADAIANVYWGVPSMTQRIQAAHQKQA